MSKAKGGPVDPGRPYIVGERGPEKFVPTKRVRLYPTADATVPGVPAIEQDVTPEEAERLLAYSPPAFTTEPPGAVAAQQPTDPPEGGSTDSEA